MSKHSINIKIESGSARLFSIAVGDGEEPFTYQAKSSINEIVLILSRCVENVNLMDSIFPSRI